jgi:hypothetical protein
MDVAQRAPSAGDPFVSEQQFDYVYFPTSCIVSLLYTMASGVTAEMGLVGNEGVIGIALFMGGDTVPNQAVIQIRQSVTVAAGRLQDAGLIHYARGHIKILDRPGLEAAACECYQVVKAEFDRWSSYAEVRR